MCIHSTTCGHLRLSTWVRVRLPALARTQDVAQGAASGDRRIKEAALDGALNDVVRAFQWLQSYRPSALHIYGDSSGGTQVVQLLVWMARLGLGRIVALYYCSAAS